MTQRLGLPISVSTSNASRLLKAAILGMRPEPGPDALYAGFADYQDALMQRLFADLAALPGLAHAA